MRSLRGQRFAQPRQIGTLGGKVKAVELQEKGMHMCDGWTSKHAACSWQPAAASMRIHLC